MTTDEHKSRTEDHTNWYCCSPWSVWLWCLQVLPVHLCKQIERDWLTDFELPTAFYYSTIVIIGCSITFHLAKKAIQKTIKAPLLHFFCYFSIVDIVCDPQFMGFGQIVMVLFHRKWELNHLSLCCDRSALNSPCWWGNFIADYNL
jgi:cytochrome c oxidase subunit 3